MEFKGYKDLVFSRSGKILTVTINRPEVMNAIGPDTEPELIRFFDEVAHDNETNVVVITGAGKAFSAGGDINQMKDMLSKPSAMYPALYTAKKLVFNILDCPKPVIAKVNGHAIGLGATLALFCDIIVASDKAKIADPHVGVGYVAGDGGAVIWPQLIGYARAKEYLMTGDVITGAEAARIGLINYAVPLEGLDAKVDELAQKLANGAARAISWTKVSVNIGLKQLAHSIMDASIAYETLSNYTADHAEAVNAFLEKRKPSFTGD